MSKLREEWNHQYTVHHTGCASISDQTEMQTHFCKLVCASFPCWVDFSCSHLRGLQLTPIQSSAKKFSKSWWKKMPVGVSGEKKREELRDM